MAGPLLRTARVGPGDAGPTRIGGGTLGRPEKRLLRSPSWLGRRARIRRFIGLDVHKAYVYGYERNEEGTGRAFRFPNTPEGWSQFCATLDGRAEVALEVTGNAYRCYDLVSPHAGKVLLVNPSALRRLGVKTDKLDAETIAEQLALGLIPEVWVPPAPIRELRVLIKHRYNLVRRRTMSNDALKAVLLRNGLGFERFGAVTPKAL